MLLDTIGIQEITAQVYNGILAPVHNQTTVICNNSYHSGFQILLVSSLAECFYILLVNNNGHTLLRLGNCQLSAVQALVLLLNSI